MSSRTIQRRLTAAGLSHHELLDRARRETAEKCIADSSLSIGEIAYLTAYSEPATFHRAFRRWTSVTPQGFRQRLRHTHRRERSSTQPGRLRGEALEGVGGRADIRITTHLWNA